jgi:hypothetical protein
MSGAFFFTRRATGGHLPFKHALVQDIAYGMLLPRSRRLSVLS